MPHSLISDFLSFLKTHHYSKNSVNSHRLDLNKFSAWVQTQRQASVQTLDVSADLFFESLKQLREADIQEYLLFLEESLKPRTIARHLSTLKLFFDYLQRHGFITKNPAYAIKAASVAPAPLPDALSSKEVYALLEAPSLQHYQGLRDRTMLELLYSTGLKVNELLALDTKDLFLDLAFLKVRGKRERMVPITAQAIKLLTLYIEEVRLTRIKNKNDLCLFPNRNGVRITRIGFWFMIKKHAQHAGITRSINPRILRHSFAIHLLENGMDLNDIRDLFGYVSLDATLQYAHVNRPDYDQVYQDFHPRAQESSNITD